MPLSLKEVEHIANLARLKLTDEEKVRYRQQLSAILDYFVQLQQLDTADIPPTSSVLPPLAKHLLPRSVCFSRAAEGGVVGSALRADEPRPGLSREDLLRNAPDTEAGQFRVPPVLE